MTDFESPRKASEDETPPDFGDWYDPSTLVSGERTRDDFLDVALQLREPTPISEIAERADRGEDSAREYMRFFAELGVVERVTEGPEQYRVDRDYLRWRRVRRVKQNHTPDEVAEMLSETTDKIDEYQRKFGFDSPDRISVVEYAEENDLDIEDVWRRVSRWKTDINRRRILDEALKTAEEKTLA
jgi:DNA-binding Lrp family transcriptional regulator